MVAGRQINIRDIERKDGYQFKAGQLEQQGFEISVYEADITAIFAKQSMS
jgi:hypothetical protein